LRLRSHGNSLRHRRPGEGRGRSSGRLGAPHRIAELDADLHSRPPGSRPARPMNPVVIVGGGMAGLAAAFELTLKNVDFVLLEAAPRAGGVVLSEEVDGYTNDGGPDALLVQK